MKNVKLMTLKKPLMGGKPSHATLGNTAIYEASSQLVIWRITMEQGQSIWMVQTKYRRGRTKQESPNRLNQALASHAYA
ncbi:hypothetical protein PIB30_087726 [Stylosanthes scabra]|uniref:Uncharacterized protein n=1 Tax=Stylosanthes scabra TaxID=79078 RepID=A0ABU6QTH6_9FABA|nr:hypothetical protein [Stylosanthes scabra]